MPISKGKKKEIIEKVDALLKDSKSVVFFNFKAFNVKSTIEMLGAKSILKNRQFEVRNALEVLHKKFDLEYVFLNLVELEKATSYLLAFDKETKNLLRRVFGHAFTKDVLLLEGVKLRKQIVPLLKQALSN